MNIIIKMLKKSMAGNLGAKLEDWSFAPSYHLGVTKNCDKAARLVSLLSVSMVLLVVPTMMGFVKVGAGLQAL